MLIELVPMIHIGSTSERLVQLWSGLHCNGLLVAILVVTGRCHVVTQHRIAVWHELHCSFILKLKVLVSCAPY